MRGLRRLLGGVLMGAGILCYFLGGFAALGCFWLGAKAVFFKGSFADLGFGVVLAFFLGIAGMVLGLIGAAIRGEEST